jgi:hypothetical protein
MANGYPAAISQNEFPSSFLVALDEWILILFFERERGVFRRILVRNWENSDTHEFLIVEYFQCSLKNSR